MPKVRVQANLKSRLKVRKLPRLKLQLNPSRLHQALRSRNRAQIQATRNKKASKKHKRRRSLKMQINNLTRRVQISHNKTKIAIRRTTQRKMIRKLIRTRRNKISKRMMIPKTRRTPRLLNQRSQQEERALSR